MNRVLYSVTFKHVLLNSLLQNIKCQRIYYFWCYKSRRYNRERHHKINFYEWKNFYLISCSSCQGTQPSNYVWREDAQVKNNIFSGVRGRQSQVGI